MATGSHGAHGAHGAHDDPQATAGGHHDQPGPDNDAPLVRPDGTPEPPHRPLPMAVGMAGTVLFLLIIAGLILYVNRDGGAPPPPTQHAIVAPAADAGADVPVLRLH